MDGSFLEENSSGSRKKDKKKRADFFRPETFTASVSDAIQDETVSSVGLEISEKKRKSRKDKKSNVADEEDQDDAQFANQLIDAALPAEMLVEPVEGEEPVKKKRKERTRLVNSDSANLENTLDDVGCAIGETDQSEKKEIDESEKEEKKSSKKSKKSAEKSVSIPVASESSETEIVEEASAAPKGILKRKSDDLSESPTGVEVTAEKKMKPSSTTIATKSTGNTYVDPAIKYLRMWKSARSSWSFQKVRQVWLLRNWRDRLKMNDEDFEIFLNYIVDLKGLGRAKTCEEAKAVRDEYESSETYGADDQLKQKLYDRAGKIVHVLTSESE